MINDTNRRLDQITFQVGKISQEIERIKRDEVTTRDILTRLARIEKRVIGE